jgi:hypothetical protein
MGRRRRRQGRGLEGAGCRRGKMDAAFGRRFSLGRAEIFAPCERGNRAGQGWKSRYVWYQGAGVFGVPPWVRWAGRLLIGGVGRLGLGRRGFARGVVGGEAGLGWAGVEERWWKFLKKVRFCQVGAGAGFCVFENLLGFVRVGRSWADAGCGKCCGLLWWERGWRGLGWGNGDEDFWKKVRFC